MSNFLKTLHGMKDVLSDEAGARRWIEQDARFLFESHGFSEIRTPLVERAEVFDRNLGVGSEIVEKEMVSFTDSGGRLVALRPEGTSGVARAVLGGGDIEGRRLFYIGEMFRGERPCFGRSRQFEQLGVEAFGKANPWADAEVASMLAEFLHGVGLRDYVLKVNTKGALGESEKVASALRAYFSEHAESLCPDCRRRLGTNAWRILDCKNECCRKTADGAPRILDLVGDESRMYFSDFRHALEALNVPYEYEPRLVRGLDYYSHVVFEAVSGKLDGLALGGGGRYRLSFRGCDETADGVGFACGMERLLLAMGDDFQCRQKGIGVVVIGMGGSTNEHALVIANELRETCANVLPDCSDRSLKGKMRNASKVGAKIVVICGEDELKKGEVTMKVMSDSTQRTVARNEIYREVDGWLRR